MPMIEQIYPRRFRCACKYFPYDHGLRPQEQLLGDYIIAEIKRYIGEILRK